MRAGEKKRKSKSLSSGDVSGFSARLERTFVQLRAPDRLQAESPCIF